MARGAGQGDDGLSRRELLGAAGLAGMAGLGLAGPRGWSAVSRALAASERRNVVLIVIDSLRADHLLDGRAHAVR